MPESARRPAQTAFAKNVKVQVMHGLASIVTTIGDYPETFVKTFYRRHLLNDAEDLRQHRTISRLWLREAGDMFCRDGQQMNWRLRVDVSEDNDVFVPVDNLRRDFTRYYPAKQALFHIRLNCTSALPASQQNSQAKIIPWRLLPAFAASSVL